MEKYNTIMNAMLCVLAVIMFINVVSARPHDTRHHHSTQTASNTELSEAQIRRTIHRLEQIELYYLHIYSRGLIDDSDMRIIQNLASVIQRLSESINCDS